MYNKIFHLRTNVTKSTWIIINATSKLSHGYNTVYISPITMYALLKINLCFRRINMKELNMEVLQFCYIDLYIIYTGK